MKKAVFPTLLTVSLFTLAAMAQENSSSAALQIRTSAEIETSCRIKAKEIAAETYRGCVTDQKNAQVEQIKKEYQDKLAALKAHYEAELKKMSGAKASERSGEETAVAPGQTGAAVESSDVMKTDQEIQAADQYQAEVTQTQEINAEVIADPNTGKMESTKVEKTEKTTKAQKTLPAKKQTTAAPSNKAPVKKTVTMKKTVTVQKKNPFQPPMEVKEVKEMSVQLKPAPKGALIDANGELPEPIPVDVQQGSI